MKILKRILAVILPAVLLCCCTFNIDKNKKTVIVATLFPQYDFCKSIVGDKAEVVLLLPPGTESHNFEPTVKDILTVSSSDMLLYTGSLLEPWADTVIEGLMGAADEKDVSPMVVDVSENIEKCAHGHDDHELENGAHEHSDDPHIWTSPKRAKQMVENILTALCERDPANRDFYRSNAETLQKELDKLDGELKIISEKCKGKTLCHGGKFALGYLTADYGISFTAAYDSCSSQAEPSAKKVVQIIESIKAQNLQAVFYEELAVPSVAETIANEANVEMLLLHSCHNLSKDELMRNESYVKLMTKNIENIKIAIGDV